VVSAASYEARKFGIQSAMPLRTAAKLCPHAIFLDGHHAKYGEWSDRVATILAKFSPIVEMVSIDEAYLDLAGTERLHGPPFAARTNFFVPSHNPPDFLAPADLAQRDWWAKVASEQAKPKGLIWDAAGQEARFLARFRCAKSRHRRSDERALRALGIE